MVRHSVVILTYNQENLIRRAIDSILNQSILPFEIIVGDDCSTDSTFQIISEYRSTYPDLFEVYRHEKNLGVFLNQNFIMQKVKGDIVSFLAGDDEFEDGIFEELNSLVEKHNINLNEKFVLVTNTLSIDKRGKSILRDNFNNRSISAFKLRLRYAIDYRSIGISANSLKAAGPVPLNFGYYGDWIWALKIDNVSSKHIFSQFVSAVYFTGIGVASKTKKEVMSNSRLMVIEEIKAIFESQLSTSDLNFLALFEKFEKYQLKPTFINYIKLISFYILNISDGNNRRFLFSYKNLFPPFVFKVIIGFRDKYLQSIP
ncbi:MAG: hypothetical protein RL638_223 [Bacteroidota bacterium]|jgi:glycosyltransferase involved in cell wall biosynthesis